MIIPTQAQIERAREIADSIVPKRRTDGHWWRTIPEANEHAIAERAALAAIIETQDESAATIKSLRDEIEYLTHKLPVRPDPQCLGDDNDGR